MTTRNGVIRDGDLGAHEVSKRFYGTVATEAALTTIPADDLVDGMVVGVAADHSMWMYDFASSATAAPGSVRAASSGTGRFHIGVSQPSTSAGGTLVKTALAATTAALPTNTRTGNVLTASSNGALGAIDDVTLTDGQRLFVKNEATGANNGIYEVTSAGSGGTPFVLTRTADADESADWKSGCLVHVQSGTVNNDKFWFLSANDPITLNTTALTFVGLSQLAPAMQAGNATLATGTIVVNAGITVAASSEVIPVLIGDITGSTNFASLRERKSARVNGAPGAGSITLDAVGDDGALDADAAGAIRYVILTPQS